MTPALVLMAVAVLPEKEADTHSVDLFLAGSAVMLVTVDIALAIDSVHGNTFSERIRVHSEKSTLLPWIAGAIAGHLFYPLNTGINRTISIAGLIGTAGAIILYGHFSEPRLSKEKQVFLFGVGMVSGSIFWGF